MPRLLRYLAVHCAIGFALGLAFGGLVVLSNVGGLRDLIASSADALIALPALLALCGLTFASLVMGGAIMMLPEGQADR
jgi:hypothetical protein